MKPIHFISPSCRNSLLNPWDIQHVEHRLGNAQGAAERADLSQDMSGTGRAVVRGPSATLPPGNASKADRGGAAPPFPRPGGNETRREPSDQSQIQLIPG